MKITTPIVDFVNEYVKKDLSRLHMPGHKGKKQLGCEHLDITEIGGADDLYSANGIIRESEENASSLFRTAYTFYSTEGSTLTIKTMLALVAEKDGYIVATRNAHKSFLHACALLDLDVEWLYPDNFSHLCCCDVTADKVKRVLSCAKNLPCAVYLTSPDYLGNILDIKSIAKVCDDYGVPLVVDNAHGAYLAFCEPSMHPIALGAHMCCDSAHKTLPVLTGGAYLHVSEKSDKKYIRNSRSRLALFASTSPSYLILQSLDLCNKTIAEGYADKIEKCIEKVKQTKEELEKNGVSIYPSEPLKIVIETKKFGYVGTELADILREEKLEFEYSDDDYIVAMVTPENDDRDYERLIGAFAKLEKKCAIESDEILPSKPKKVMSIRSAVFSESESVSVDDAEGRICASPTVSCPPAVPVVMSGEQISREEIALLKRYGIETIELVKGED